MRSVLTVITILILAVACNTEPSGLIIDGADKIEGFSRIETQRLGSDRREITVFDSHIKGPAPVFLVDGISIFCVNYPGSYPGIDRLKLTQYIEKVIQRAP